MLESGNISLNGSDVTLNSRDVATDVVNIRSDLSERCVKVSDNICYRSDIYTLCISIIDVYFRRCLVKYAVDPEEITFITMRSASIACFRRVSECVLDE